VKLGPADPDLIQLQANKSTTTQKLVAIAKSLEILKTKISDLSSTRKTLSYGVQIAKITRGLCFAYDTKLVAMATSVEESEKLRPNSQTLS